MTKPVRATSAASLGQPVERDLRDKAAEILGQRHDCPPELQSSPHYAPVLGQRLIRVHRDLHSAAGQRIFISTHLRPRKLSRNNRLTLIPRISAAEKIGEKTRLAARRQRNLETILHMQKISLCEGHQGYGASSVPRTSSARSAIAICARRPGSVGPLFEPPTRAGSRQALNQSATAPPSFSRNPPSTGS